MLHQIHPLRSLYPPMSTLVHIVYKDFDYDFFIFDIETKAFSKKVYATLEFEIQNQESVKFYNRRKGHFWIAFLLLVRKKNNPHQITTKKKIVTVYFKIAGIMKAIKEAKNYFLLILKVCK